MNVPKEPTDAVWATYVDSPLSASAIVNTPVVTVDPSSTSAPVLTPARTGMSFASVTVTVNACAKDNPPLSVAVTPTETEGSVSKSNDCPEISFS